jgi:hypothetical protein
VEVVVVLAITHLLVAGVGARVSQSVYLARLLARPKLLPFLRLQQVLLPHRHQEHKGGIQLLALLLLLTAAAAVVAVLQLLPAGVVVDHCRLALLVILIPHW